MANDAATDLVTAADGTSFAVRARNIAEIRGSNLSLFSSPASPELENIAGRLAVPGIALHPAGALIYEPFLDGPAPTDPPATGIHGGIDIRDAHSGQLRLRLYLPEAFAMLNTDIDGLHGGFLTTDEIGQRLFAITTDGLSIVQLANVPLGIGTLSPSAGAAVGGTTVIVRGERISERNQSCVRRQICDGWNQGYEYSDSYFTGSLAGTTTAHPYESRWRISFS